MDAAYVYRATCERVVDGDTFVLRVDLGFRCAVSLEARLHGIDVYERSTPEGKYATEFVAGLLNGQTVVVRSYRDERSFARWVCDIWLPDGRVLADVMREAGYEKP